MGRWGDGEIELSGNAIVKRRSSIEKGFIHYGKRF